MEMKADYNHLIDAFDYITFDFSKFHQFDLPLAIEVEFKEIKDPQLLIEDKRNG